MNTAPRNAAAEAIAAEVDSGTTDPNGKLQLWSGTYPTEIGDTPSGSLLAEFDYENPSFGAPSNGAVSAQGLPKTTTGLDDGEVTWYRVLDRDGTPVWDNDSVGTSGTALELNTTTISTGVDVTMNSHTLTMPAS